MTLTANPSCIGTFNAATAFGISTYTPFKFSPAIDFYTQAASFGLFNVFAAPQNSLFPSTGPFSISSDQELVGKATYIGLHVLSPLKPSTFTPLHAHAFAASANGYISAPDEPTEKLEAAGKDTKDLSQWIEDLGSPDILVRRDAIRTMGKIVLQLNPGDRLEPALKIAERIWDGDKDVRESAIHILGDIVQHLEPAERLMLARKAEQRPVGVSASDEISVLKKMMPHLEESIRVNYIRKMAKMLNDRDKGVRATAVKALGDIMSRLDESVNMNYIRKMAKMLKDGDKDVRKAAIEALVSMIPRLNPGDRLEPALKIAETAGFIPGALGDIVPHLDPADRQKLARKLEDSLGYKYAYRISEFGDIVPHLEKSVRKEFALKILILAKRLEIGGEHEFMREAAIRALQKIVHRLDPADRIEVDNKAKRWLKQWKSVRR